MNIAILSITALASLASGPSTVYYPGECDQKLYGLAEWHNEQGALVEDGVGATAWISAEWPNFESNPLYFWDFSAGATTSSGEIVVVARQDGDVPDMYIRVTLISKSGEILTLYPDWWENVTNELQAIHYAIGKPVSDWSTEEVQVVVTSGLTSSATCEVDAVWAQ